MNTRKYLTVLNLTPIRWTHGKSACPHTRSLQNIPRSPENVRKSPKNVPVSPNNFPKSTQDLPRLIHILLFGFGGICCSKIAKGTTDAKIRGLIWACTSGVIWGRSWGDYRWFEGILGWPRNSDWWKHFFFLFRPSGVRFSTFFIFHHVHLLERRWNSVVLTRA